jgi:hypothetical protein
VISEITAKGAPEEFGSRTSATRKRKRPEDKLVEDNVDVSMGTMTKRLPALVPKRQKL